MNRALRVLVALAAIVTALELGLRLAEPGPRERPAVPLLTLVDSPLIYGLNPEHPDVNELGLRGPVPELPKPEGRKRVLVLGDSVAFGTGVDPEQAFPALLRARLDDSGDLVDASVEGYTPWNQLQFVRTRAAELEPDVVLVAFCLNDVANPKLHWIETTGAPLIDVPDAAIPNMRHDAEYVQPKLSEAFFGGDDEPLWKRSKLVRWIEQRFEPRPFRAEVPLRITREDEELEIGCLLDEDSPEWKWLTATYRALHAAVTERGARLAVAFFPLAYQLAPDYPHQPQAKLAEWCASEGIPALDLTDDLRELGTERAFLLDEGRGFHDVWHLTPEGHELTAARLLDFLDGLD